MAGVRGYLNVSSVALVASTPKTVGQVVAAANHRTHITEYNISFNGVVSTDNPVLVEFLIQTDAGTTSAWTPIKANATDDETLQTTGRHTATAEPTTTDIKFSSRVHPQSGWHVQLPFNEAIPVPGGTRLGVRCTSGAAPAANLTANLFIKFEE